MFLSSEDEQKPGDFGGSMSNGGGKVKFNLDQELGDILAIQEAPRWLLELVVARYEPSKGLVTLGLNEEARLDKELNKTRLDKEDGDLWMNDRFTASFYGDPSTHDSRQEIVSMSCGLGCLHDDVSRAKRLTFYSTHNEYKNLWLVTSNTGRGLIGVAIKNDDNVHLISMHCLGGLETAPASPVHGSVRGRYELTLDMKQFSGLVRRLELMNERSHIWEKKPCPKKIAMPDKRWYDDCSDTSG